MTPKVGEVIPLYRGRKGTVTAVENETWDDGTVHVRLYFRYHMADGRLSGTVRNMYWCQTNEGA